MSQITLELPQKVARKFLHKTKISYQEIIEDYENSFEYESVNMRIGDFKKFLISEIKHD